VVAEASTVEAAVAAMAVATVIPTIKNTQLQKKLSKWFSY